MALQEKYKGMSFAKIAEEINKTYKDRFDPISIRALNSEMKSLEEAQEYIKQKNEIQTNLEATRQQVQEKQQQQFQSDIPQQQDNFQAAPPTAGNEGVGFQPTEQQDTFNRAASSTYNEKFADGGNMFGNGGGILGLGLQAAPLLIDGLQLGQLERAAPTPRRTINADITGALSKFKPRETNFKNIDINNIERGMIESSARFAQNNINASRGNAGSFVANQLANSANLASSIGQARMAAQVEDRKTAQLNASEKARGDALNLRKNTSIARLDLNKARINSQINTRADDADAANLAAFESARADLQSSIGNNLGTIGKTIFDNARISKLYGYDILGNYKNGTPEQKSKSISTMMELSGVSEEEAIAILEQQAKEDKEVNLRDFSKELKLTSDILKGVRKNK